MPTWTCGPDHQLALQAAWPTVPASLGMPKEKPWVIRGAQGLAEGLVLVRGHVLQAAGVAKQAADGFDAALVEIADRHLEGQVLHRPPPKDAARRLW